MDKNKNARWFKNLMESPKFNIPYWLLFAFTASMFIMGTIYLDKCQIENYIPIWLVVSGACFSTVMATKLVLRLLPEKENKEEDDKFFIIFRVVAVYDALVATFLIGWLIAGCYWIFSNYNLVTFTMRRFSNPHYCNRHLYLFAFSSVTLVLALIFSAFIASMYKLYSFFRKKSQ